MTWHVHGNYLYYLAHAQVEFVIPVDPRRGAGFGGRGSTFLFGANVVECPADEIQHEPLDCILFQTRKNYEADQFDILSAQQRSLPQIYLQHDPPWNDPTNEPHWFDEPDGLLVHVTAFNALMWDSGRTASKVIDHGVTVPSTVNYTGDIQRGIVVVNHLHKRGRRLGADVFDSLRLHVPLDLVGMETDVDGGLGEVPPMDLPRFISRYRFFFNPIRWTSLGLAIIEAMMIGLPIVGLATTELVTVIKNGESGFLETDPTHLVEPIHALLEDRALAGKLGARARDYALERFGIGRFAREWETTFAEVTGREIARSAPVRTALQSTAGSPR
jgi:hypothetical protein